MTQPKQPEYTLGVIYIKDLDNYVATYKDSSQYCTFEVDGEVLPLSYSTSSVVLDKEALDKVVVKTTNTFATHYEDVDGDKLSIEEYNKNITDLLEYYDEDSEEWSDIDSEYSYKKFSAKWHRKTETKVEFHKPTIKIVEVQISTGSKFITPVWSISSLPDEKRLYVLDIFSKAKAVFANICKEYEVKFEIPTHSAMQYAKVGGEYLFSGTTDKYKTPMSGTLEVLKQKEQEIQAEIEHAVKVIVARQRGISLSKATFEEVHKGLRAIQSNIGQLDVKQKSYSAQRTVMQQISALLSSVEKAAAEKL